MSEVWWEIAVVLMLALLGLGMMEILILVLGRMTILWYRRQPFHLVWRKGCDYEIIPLRVGQIVELDTELFAEALAEGFVQVTRGDHVPMIVREGYVHSRRVDGCSFKLYVGSKSYQRAESFVRRRKVVNGLRATFGYDPK